MGQCRPRMAFAASRATPLLLVVTCFVMAMASGGSCGRSQFAFADEQSTSDADIRARIAKHQPEMRWIENDHIKLGIDLKLGGAITFLSTSRHPGNMVNNWDWGRQIQMSFYAGPEKFRVPGREVAAAWADFPWNPVQAGDHFGNSSRVIQFEQTGKSLKLTAIPMQWSLDNAPTECRIHSEIELDGPMVRLKQRLENSRSDQTFFAARDQELPAIYLTGDFNRLMAYRGNAPWQQQQLEEIRHVPGPDGFPWARFIATEGWVALVNREGYGLGVWQSGNPLFLGGVADSRTPSQKEATPDSGVASSHFPTGYIASIRPEHLDHDIDYRFQTLLVLGDLAEIRRIIGQEADRRGLPRWDFQKGRQGWTWQGPTEALKRIGEEHAVDGEIVGVMANGQIHLVSPPCVWLLSQGRKITAEIKLESPTPVRLDLYWQHPDDTGFVAEQRVSTMFHQPAASSTEGAKSLGSGETAETQATGYGTVTWDIPQGADTLPREPQTIISRLRITANLPTQKDMLPVKIRRIQTSLD